jgi:hypothetical protein
MKSQVEGAIGVLWIVEDKKAEQVYEFLMNLKMDYTIAKYHYMLTLQENAHLTLNNKKTRS